MHFIFFLNMYRSLLIAALFQKVFAMSPGPAATQFRLLTNEEMAMKGISPAPTPAPRKRNPASLFKRQSEISIGVETCGFLRGDWDLPVSCSEGVSCLFDKTLSWFGCCVDQDACADVKTWCVPGRSVSNTVRRISTLTCNDGASTECLTYLNVRIDKDFTYTKYECDVSGGPAYLYYDATSTPITSVSSTPIPTPTPTPISTTSVSTSPPPSPQHSTPVGAIVGGVIGGIATLALVGFGIFFLMRRKRTAASGPIPYDQPVSTDVQGRPAPIVIPETHQYPNSTSTASPRVDTKGVVPLTSPSSPTPPYQPPYSPPPKTVQAHEAHIAQLP